MAHATLAPVIAHRGASGEAPENTLSAIQLAAAQGASCVEIDVSISADAVPFVHHDHQLQRCTDGDGFLHEHTAQQLDRLTAGKLMPGFEQEPLPRLNAVLALLMRYRLGLNLEIKPYKGLEQRTVDAISNELDGFWPDDLPLVISSFSHDSIGMIKDRLPQVARAPLVGAVPDDIIELMRRYDAQNLHCAGDALTRDKANEVICAGYGLYCYTVNDPDTARKLWSWGVHGVFTDYPKTLLSLFVT